MNIKPLTVEVTDTANRRRGAFLNHTGCLICKAIKSQFRGAKVYARFSTVDVRLPGGPAACYEIVDPARVRDAYQIPKDEFVPFTVVLKPYHYQGNLQCG